MEDERWGDIIGRAKDAFAILEEGKEDFSEDEGPGFREFVIFEGPLGKIKLERVTRPIVIDKKTFGSRRIGGETSVEYIYSENEFSKKFHAYRWDEGEEGWKEMEASQFDS